jgi:serine/threonine protein phosphatase PrpC
VSTAAVQDRICTACGAPATQEARFCEACGTDLPPSAGAPGAEAVEPATEPPAGPTPAAAGPTPAAQPAPPCADCGGEVAPDGYCVQCGTKAPRPRDHMVEQPQPWVAGVSDRGVRHHRNEDAMATDAEEVPGSRAVLVVCDGVSTSEDSDVASLAAARAARDVLVAARARGLGTDSGLTAVIGAAIEDAVDAANDAVAAATSPDHGDSPPSCTFVAAVLQGRRVVAGVVGDSRAYWLPDEGSPEALTVDDSWAAEQIAAGATREAAESGAQAHAITRWLGVDAPDHAPRLTNRDLAGAGWLLLCSDGLWNYASEATALAAVVHDAAHGAGGEPGATASALVDWANAQGGHDNITVVLARLDAGPATAAAHDTDGGGAR